MRAITDKQRNALNLLRCVKVINTMDTVLGEARGMNRDDIVASLTDQRARIRELINVLPGF